MARNLRRTATAAVTAARSLLRHEYTRSIELDPSWAVPKIYSCSKNSAGKITHVHVAHPFQTGGPVKTLQVDKVKEGVLIRVDMPGVGESGYKVKMKDNKIKFEGTGEAEHESEKPRSYSGGWDIEAEEFETEEYESEMRDCVLMILVKGKLKITGAQFRSPM